MSRQIIFSAIISKYSTIWAELSDNLFQVLYRVQHDSYISWGVKSLVQCPLLYCPMPSMKYNSTTICHHIEVPYIQYLRWIVCTWLTDQWNCWPCEGHWVLWACTWVSLLRAREDWFSLRRCTWELRNQDRDWLTQLIDCWHPHALADVHATSHTV